MLGRFWYKWAVASLFGATRTVRQQTYLTLLIGAAVSWPLFVAGFFAPKFVTQFVTFLPIGDAISPHVEGAIWVGVAALVPLWVGVALTAPADGEPPPRWSVRAGRMLRGFPTTVGLSAAFIFMLISMPLMHLVGYVRRQDTAEIPLLTTAKTYPVVADQICAALNHHGLPLRRAKPHWWISAPVRLLSWLAGNSMRTPVPTQLQHFETETVTFTLYPTGLVLSGSAEAVTWAHGLVAEMAVHTDGLLTTHPKAQELEQRLRSIWKAHQADADKDHLCRELAEVTHVLRTLRVSWNDWQLLYRQVLQLGRALAGQEQLLASEPNPFPGHRPGSPYLGDG
jgi:hypothetical protein